MTGLNEIYYKYLSIQDRSFEEKNKFFQKHIDSIKRLKPSVKIELYYNYLQTLASLSRHETVILLAQELLELSISERIYYIGNRDVYKEVLNIKAKSHLEHGDIEEAESIFIQLCKMYPREKKYYKSLTKVNRRRLHSQNQMIRAACILLFLLTAAIIAIELLVVSPFYNQYLSPVRLLRNSTLGFALVLFILFKLKLLIIDYSAIRAVKNDILNKFNK